MRRTIIIGLTAILSYTIGTAGGIKNSIVGEQTNDAPTMTQESIQTISTVTPSATYDYCLQGFGVSKPTNDIVINASGIKIVR